jgi:hypothetical protein
MTGHGFRAMARTILDEVLHVRPDYIEHQLAHAVKDPNGRAYNRTAHLPAANFPIDISGIANTSWGILVEEPRFRPAIRPYNGIPFNIPTGSSNAWVGFNGTLPATVTINPNITNATTTP